MSVMANYGVDYVVVGLKGVLFVAMWSGQSATGEEVELVLIWEDKVMVRKQKVGEGVDKAIQVGGLEREGRC